MTQILISLTSNVTCLFSRPLYFGKTKYFAGNDLYFYDQSCREKTTPSRLFSAVNVLYLLLHSPSGRAIFFIRNVNTTRHSVLWQRWYSYLWGAITGKWPVTDFCTDGDEILNYITSLAGLFVRHRSKDNIKVDVKTTEWESMDWIYLLNGGTSGGLLWRW
jgi:hypothetical protein